MRFHSQGKKHRHNSFWTWTALGINCISHTLALCLNSLALLDLHWLMIIVALPVPTALLDLQTKSSVHNGEKTLLYQANWLPHMKGFLGKMLRFCCKYVNSFFLKRDITEHQMRAMKVTKGSQATSQPPPYIKDSRKTQVSNLNSRGVFQEHHMLQQAKKWTLGLLSNGKQIKKWIRLCAEKFHFRMKGGL